MKKAVIFDLDGTLLDTSGDICKVLNGSLAAFGLPAVSRQKTLEYVGNGAKILVERALPAGKKHLLEDVYAHYAAHFAVCDNSLTCLYDGEEEVLRALKDAGIALGIVTNKPQAATVRVYEKYLSRFGFGQVLGQSEKFPLKPNPAGALRMLKEFGVEKKDCLFVGDGETDVQTAKNAGIDCVSVLWGYRSRAQLKAAGASQFVNKYNELPNFIL